MIKELQIFEKHVNEKGLKRSNKREQVVRAFLNTKKHVSAEDLFSEVRKDNSTVGYTTVYRTLKLIVSSGLGEMVDFDDGVRRFERKVGREYHAHFICTNCADNFEVFDKGIEELSSRLSAGKKFSPKKHRLEIFGLCKKCS